MLAPQPALAAEEVSSATVALCFGPSPEQCAFRCSGVLLSSTVVATARHCAQRSAKDSACNAGLDDLSLVEPNQVMVTNAPALPNQGAIYRKGVRWASPAWRAACGHDIALLEIDAEVVPKPSQYAVPRFQPKPASSLSLVGYAFPQASDPAGFRYRRSVDAGAICIGGVDACTGPAEGKDLGYAEVALNLTVCKGDSGTPVFVRGESTLLGVLTRALGDSSACGTAIATGFAEHALLLGKTVRAASIRQNAAEPTWVAAALARGNSDTISRGALGMPCDGADECTDGICASPDGGRTLQCSRACDVNACPDSFDCIKVPEGARCFVSTNPSSDSCSTRPDTSHAGSSFGILTGLSALILGLRKHRWTRTSTARRRV